MAERLIAPVLKTGLGKTNGGSNPSLSAERMKKDPCESGVLIYEVKREKFRLFGAERNKSKKPEGSCLILTMGESGITLVIPLSPQNGSTGSRFGGGYYLGRKPRKTGFSKLNGINNDRFLPHILSAND